MCTETVHEENIIQTIQNLQRTWRTNSAKQRSKHVTNYHASFTTTSRNLWSAKLTKKSRQWPKRLLTSAVHQYIHTSTYRTNHFTLKINNNFKNHFSSTRNQTFSFEYQTLNKICEEQTALWQVRFRLPILPLDPNHQWSQPPVRRSQISHSHEQPRTKTLSSEDGHL